METSFLATYLLRGAADKHGALKRSKLLVRRQVHHTLIRIDHHPHMVLIIVDPNLLPLAGVEFPMGFDHHLTLVALVQGELEGEEVILERKNRDRKTHHSNL